MNRKNIKFETLYRKGNKKIIIFIVAFIFIGGLVLGINLSHAAFTSSFDVPFVRGKINYKHPDFKMVSMHVQDSAGSSTYNETNTMPSGSEYVINSSKSYCTKGVQGEKDTGVEMKTVDGNHVMNNLTKNDRCFLYFDVAPLNVAGIFAKYTKDDSRNGSISGPFIGSTPTTVYSAVDDGGTSYVFAGVNPNNWVKLGNIYFRIIRFNGNGSMRLIYSGAGTPATSGTGTRIGAKAFNTNNNDNMYVGLQYSSGQIHGTGTNSTILGETNSTDATTLYGWYNNNIKTTYGSLIDSTIGFCSDRDSFTDRHGTTSGGGTGTTATYYGGYIRYLEDVEWKTIYTPTLKCKEAYDLLTLPVGLITSDEYILAGGGPGNSNANTTFWLHTKENYWTMTPANFNGASAFIFSASSSGSIELWSLSNKFGIRPVINLKSTTNFESNGADGSSSKPWTVKI